MKKTYWIIAWLLLTFIGDRLAGWAMGKIVHDSQFRYSRLYRGDARCDILLVGNSRGLVFFQPYIEEKSGLATFNLSYNGLPMDLASTLVMDHLDRHKPPRLLVIDISLLDKRMDAKLLNAFNPYTIYSERFSALISDSFPNTYYGGQVSHLFRYNGEVFQRALFYWKKSDKSWLLDRVISPTLMEQVKSQPAFVYDFTPPMFDHLNEMVKYAQKKGVRVELVVNPYYPPFAKKITNLRDLIEKAEETTGLKVHDYSKSINDADSFGDYQHLNKQGCAGYLDLLFEDGILISPKR